MKFSVVSSGSKGNMTYVEANQTRLLIDCGISFSNAKSRLPIVDFSLVTDILITHEHTDHTEFLDTIVKRTNASIYISKKTFMALKPKTRDNLIGRKIGFIEEDSCYVIGEVKVCTIKLLHDASNNFGFIIIHNDKRIGYFTDTGIFPSRYKDLLKTLDAFIIEANHNVEMLLNSNRDYNLINRILSTSGHISNQTCYEILSSVLSDKTKYVVLAHISEDCNSLECINSEIIYKLKNYNTKIILGSQKEATDLLEV